MTLTFPYRAYPSVPMVRQLIPAGAPIIRYRPVISILASGPAPGRHHCRIGDAFADTGTDFTVFGWQLAAFLGVSAFVHQLHHRWKGHSYSVRFFPQTPDAKWKDVLDAEAYQAFAETHLHTIGNLTLSGNNGSLGNKIFAEKKQMNHEGKEQGYTFSRLRLNRYIKDIDHWNLETYGERTRLLSERVLEIWCYPDFDIPDAASKEEVSIFEAEDPTGRKLEYAVFADERREVTTVSDLYLLVMRELYARNPEPFFASNLRDRLRLSKNASDCRNAFELHDGCYIEGNLSSLAKFERLQEALTLFDSEEDLTIQYAN